MNRWSAKLKELTHSTFGLTEGERKAVCLVLAIAILGLGVKCWHAYQKRQASPGDATSSLMHLTWPSLTGKI